MTNEIDDRSVDPALRRELAEVMAHTMLDPIEGLPAGWREHVAKMVVAELCKSNDDWDVAGAAAVARSQLEVLSGLHSAPTFSAEMLDATLSGYADTPTELVMAGAEGDTHVDDVPAASVRDRFLGSIAESMVETALDGIRLPAGTVESLLPAVIQALKGGNDESVDDEGARNVIRQKVLALTRHDPDFNQADFQERLAAA